MTKPVPKTIADQRLLERRRESINHEDEEMSLSTRPVAVQWKWNYFNEEAGTKMHKVGWKSRKDWAKAMGLRSLLAEIEERIGKVNKQWVDIERRERPLPKRKEKRWVEGERGWTGLIMDDIAV